MFCTTVIALMMCLADAPRVAEMTPANNATDVDPSIVELRVTFDRDMDTGGYSFTGGGPKFPKTTGKPRWIDKRTAVMPVALEPGQRYELGINAASFKNFRSAEGVPVEPVRWTFKTRDPSKKSDPEAQRKANRQAADELAAVLTNRYSYYDLHRDVLPKPAELTKRLLDAPDTDSWVQTAASALEPAKDLHLWFEHDGETYATGRRAIDPNFNPNGVASVLANYKKLGNNTARARTDDGIGYILIATWSQSLANELDLVEQALGSMLDCKAIIVDVRPNSGGDELLARRIAGWFVEEPKVYARNRNRDPNVPGGWTQTYERIIEPHSPDKRFKGKLAVLTGPANMSSCESFIKMMQQSPRCTTIGEKTWGSSGNPKPQPLSNGVTIFVPSWQDLLPDGTVLEGRGIEPDVKVTAAHAAFATGDPVIQRAVTILRGESSR